MHKIKTFARSKAHAHGYNPWSNDKLDPSVLPGSPHTTAPPGPSAVPVINNNSAGEPVINEKDSRKKHKKNKHKHRSTGSSNNSQNNTTFLSEGQAGVKNDVPGTFPGSAQPPQQTDTATINTVTTDINSETPSTEIKKNVAVRFMHTLKIILFSSWINVLLIFVPVGIACQVAHVNPTVVFVVNAIAIVPLAGLLSFATESVAHRLGDTIGALMNVTFGNAVELIILIALIKNEIRIVQASLLGSVLANLLLILGMCFLFGGLKYREQLYNSTITQMSACLLSLSVMSLLLPTAFHASFADSNAADRATLKVSRGTSVILLLVYVLYLIFQLVSHPYMYESTPQARIDEESHPGWLTDHFGSSSSSSSSSGSRRSSLSSSDGESVNRITRSLRKFRRRSTAAGSDEKARSLSSSSQQADTEDARGRKKIREKYKKTHGNQVVDDVAVVDAKDAPVPKPVPAPTPKAVAFRGVPPMADSLPLPVTAGPSNERRSGISAINPRRLLSYQAKPTGTTTTTTIDQRIELDALHPQTSNPVAIRRANSLPPRLTRLQSTQPMAIPHIVIPREAHLDEDEENKNNISRTSAVCLLLGSTALVAVCAEFMVGSIDHLVDDTPLGEAFVGLILLPIVGNAAEHVTAVTVAAKNKMDLAIGVAVGSSIQIALFVTPIIVLLGWAMGKEMGLFFNIFETVVLFASTFIVNFLVLDGRSNYLEGTLLIASYVIIAVAAFFYPAEANQSIYGTGGS